MASTRKKTTIQREHRSKEQQKSHASTCTTLNHTAHKH